MTPATTALVLQAEDIIHERADEERFTKGRDEFRAIAAAVRTMREHVAALESECVGLREANDKRVQDFLSEKVCCDGHDCGCGGVTRLQQMVAEEAGAQLTEARELVECCDKKMEDSDWARQYREACITISQMSDQLAAARSELVAAREANTRLQGKDNTEAGYVFNQMRKAAEVLGVDPYTFKAHKLAEAAAMLAARATKGGT